MTFDITPAATRFMRLIWTLRASAASDDSGLRLSLSGGAAGRLEGAISVVRGPEPSEVVVEHGGVRLFLPSSTRALLDGLTIDFGDSLSGLVFHTAKPRRGAEALPTVAL